MYSIEWLFGIDIVKNFTFTYLSVDAYDINLNDVLIGNLRLINNTWQFYSVIPIEVNDMEKLTIEINKLLVN